MSAPATRHDAIANRLRDEILRGTYRPGDRLPGERDLAQRLGVHRSSVREALCKLEQLGLVAIRHGGGATVLQLEEASLEVVRHMLFVDGQPNRLLIEQLLDVHELLIAGATRLAVERGSDDELLDAREIILSMKAADASDDEYLDGAAELLELIARASQNLVLRLARNAVDPLFEGRYREVRKRFRPPAPLFAPVADQLLAAMGNRDAAAAEEAVRALLRLNRGRALDALDELHVEDAPLDETPPPPADGVEG